MTDRKSNPVKTGARSGGPKTAKGKDASSLNAVKHGATSPRLLNAHEVGNFVNFRKELSLYYKSSNPLVNLQIDRISRLKVLVERVQEQMDSLHRIAAIRSSNFNRAIKAMDLDDDQARQAAEIMNWLTRNSEPNKKNFPLDRNQMQLVFELQDFADGYTNLLSSHEDFLKLVPHFCKYIVREANDRQQTLNEYLLSHRPPETVSSSPAKHLIITIDPVSESIKKSHNGQWREATITDVPIEALKTAMMWLYNESLTYMKNFDRALHIKHVMDEVDGLAMPEPAEIDRLMRYQTTLQRQLSAAIGELLALIDREGHA